MDFDDLDMDDETGMEVQSLQAIFDTDLKVLNKSPWTLNVIINPTTDEDTNYVAVKLNVTMPKTYPDDAPEITVQLEKGLSNNHREVLQKLVREQASELVGMAMMFDITETVKEYLQEHNKETKSEYQLMVERTEQKKSKESIEDKAKKAKKAQAEFISPIKWVADNANDPVSKENFKTWKDAFDAEGNKNTTITFSVKKASKASGREIFEKDAQLGIIKDDSKKEGGEAEVFYFNENLYDDDDLPEDDDD